MKRIVLLVLAAMGALVVMALLYDWLFGAESWNKMMDRLGKGWT